MVKFLENARLFLIDLLGGVSKERHDRLFEDYAFFMNRCRDVWIEKNGDFYRLRIGKWAGYYTYSEKGLENMIESLIIPPGLEIRSKENGQ